jgi:hypothetical protein
MSDAPLDLDAIERDLANVERTMEHLESGAPDSETDGLSA